MNILSPENSMNVPAEVSKSPVPKAVILRELAPFAKPDTVKGLVLFFFDFVIYSSAIAAVLFAPSMIWKLVGSVIAGIKLTGLLTLGHDAAHRTLVKNKTLNKWLACACFAPCMHNYRLWVWDHHEIHHQKSNSDHFDSYTPYSKQEYDRLPWPKQMFERIIRAPNVIGFGIHYLFQRMPRVRLFPTKAVPQRHRKSAWRHFAGLIACHSVFLAILFVAPAFAPVTSASAIVLGFVLPMCIFVTLTGGTLYLMHTHPDIPWFKGELDRKGDAAAEYCATDLTMPAPVSKLIHHIFTHSLHHAHPGVPSYYALQAQKRLNQLLGDRAVSEPLSFSRVVVTLKTCKLYDFERHQWLDFKGRPTTAPLFPARARTQSERKIEIDQAM